MKPGDLAALSLIGLVALVVFPVRLLRGTPEPDWGMGMPCLSTKPEGVAWLDVGSPLPCSLTVEVDRDLDLKADEFWRAEGAGKIALYWPGSLNVGYRAIAVVDGEEYKPTHWFRCP